MAVKPYMFPRSSKGKLLVPIGWNNLTIRTKEGTTRNGKRMVKLLMYIKPTDRMYGYRMGQRQSFRPITCIHMEGEGDISTWYTPFSTMPKAELDRLLTFQGKVFKGLVRHVQKCLVKDGRRVQDGRENQLFYFSAELEKAKPLDGEEDGYCADDLLKTMDYDLSVWKSSAMRKLIDTFDLSFDHFDYNM